MKGFGTKHNDDSTIKWLRDFESETIRMIRGIWQFIINRLPEIMRDLLHDLYEKMDYAGHVAFRAGRALGVLILWLAITFGPFFLLPWYVSLGWMVIALAGSYYGVQKIQQHQVIAKRMDGHA
jgi:hypothetical protein